MENKQKERKDGVLGGSKTSYKNKLMGESKRRINSIDIFRYICSVMVIAIHTAPFSDINEQLGYVFSQIIPRIAVPFFFAVSGYFYMSKMENGNNCFFKYLKRLLSTYFIWSFLYYTIDYVTWGHENSINFITQGIYRLIITGSHYHLWFFPALIFSLCISTLLFKVKCKYILIPLSIGLYIIGCLGCSYYKIGIKIPILQNLFTSSHFEIIRRVLLMGFPFFVCGYLVYKIQYKLQGKLKNMTQLCIWIVSVAIWLIEICSVRILKCENNIIITFGLYLLVITTLWILIRNPLSESNKIAEKCRVLANFTYYAHPFWMMCVSFSASYLFGINISATVLFILTLIITYIGGIIIYKLDNRYINQIVK